MKTNKLVTIICVCIMFAIGIATLASDNKTDAFSESENRMLSGIPEMTFDTILSGEFASGFEKYMIDRIPLRDKIINIQSKIAQSMSIVTLEDTLNVIDTKAINQMEGLDSDELQEEAPAKTAQISPTPQITPSAEDTPAETKIEATYTPEPTATPDQKKFNNSRHKSIGFVDNDTGKTTYLISFETSDVVSYANTINQFTSLLPNDGNLVHVFALESSKARPAISAFNLDKDISIFDQTVEVLEYYTTNQAHIISAPIVLEEPIKNKEQMYFFTDHHWTVEGIHRVYTEAMNQIGITPLKWEDYDVTYEHPFLGAYYRDTHAGYYAENPDTLAIVDFPQADTFTHYLGDDNIDELPILNFDAPSNDRYRIYYDGPKSVGPLSVINTTNDINRNALIVLDSYGLPFSCMLIPHYDNICIMDLRYMYKSTEKYYISDIVDEYDIDDIFVVLGDVDSFGQYYSKSMSVYMNNPEK